MSGRVITGEEILRRFPEMVLHRDLVHGVIMFCDLVIRRQGRARGIVNLSRLVKDIIKNTEPVSSGVEPDPDQRKRRLNASSGL